MATAPLKANVLKPEDLAKIILAARIAQGIRRGLSPMEKEQLDREVRDVETDRTYYTRAEEEGRAGVSTSVIYGGLEQVSSDALVLANKILALRQTKTDLMGSGATDTEISRVQSEIDQLASQISIARSALSRLAPETNVLGESTDTKIPGKVERTVSKLTMGLVGKSRPTEITTTYHETTASDGRILAGVSRAESELIGIRERVGGELIQAEGTSRPIKLEGDELIQSKQLVNEIIIARENGNLDIAVQRAQELAKIQEHGMVSDIGLLATSGQADRVEQQITGSETGAKVPTGTISERLKTADKRYETGEITSGAELEKIAAQEAFTLSVLKRQVSALENSGDKQGAMELAQQIEKISGEQIKEDKPTLEPYVGAVMAVSSGEILDNRGKIPEETVLAIGEGISLKSGKPISEVLLQDPKSIRDAAFDSREIDELKSLLGKSGRRKQEIDLLQWLEEISREESQR